MKCFRHVFAAGLLCLITLFPGCAFKLTDEATGRPSIALADRPAVLPFYNVYNTAVAWERLGILNDTDDDRIDAMFVVDYAVLRIGLDRSSGHPKLIKIDSEDYLLSWVGFRRGYGPGTFHWQFLSGADMHPMSEHRRVAVSRPVFDYDVAYHPDTEQILVAASISTDRDRILFESAAITKSNDVLHPYNTIGSPLSRLQPRIAVGRDSFLVALIERDDLGDRGNRICVAHYYSSGERETLWGFPNVAGGNDMPGIPAAAFGSFEGVDIAYDSRRNQYLVIYTTGSGELHARIFRLQYSEGGDRITGYEVSGIISRSDGRHIVAPAIHITSPGPATKPMLVYNQCKDEYALAYRVNAGLAHVDRWLLYVQLLDGNVRTIGEPRNFTQGRIGGISSYHDGDLISNGEYGYAVVFEERLYRERSGTYYEDSDSARIWFKPIARGSWSCVE